MPKKRKLTGTSRGYKSTTDLLKAYKPRKVRIVTTKTKKKVPYKIPKTPKNSGRGWGG